MTFTDFTLWLSRLAAFFALAAFAAQLWRFSRLPRPADFAPPRGSAARGVLYAFTLGMAPWAKESTRLHTLAYLRGVAFHLAIFFGLAVFLAYPWLLSAAPAMRQLLAFLLGAGALLGLAGLAARRIEPNLRLLSSPDDLFAVSLVTLFLAAGGLGLAAPGLASLFYLISAGLLLYAPLGKIRHSIYYPLSRLYFGRFVGRRGVLPHSRPAGLEKAEVTNGG
jgi:hypothetical protein